jgi:alpha-galactosidase
LTINRINLIRDGEHMLPTKIVLIGAGSANFGLNTLSSVMRSNRLRGSQLALVDHNIEALEAMHQLARRLNLEWKAGMTISSHTHHKDALQDAMFVVSAIEVTPRERLWRKDFEITLKYGVRQPYAENGGPGGLFHTARNIAPILEITKDMETACPDAWYINFTNPMIRICDLIHRYTKIKVIGLCHQIFAGYGMVGYLMADKLGIKLPNGPFSTHADPRFWINLGKIADQTVNKVDIKASGLNHFTWILSIHDRKTGEDLYPYLTEAWENANPMVEPLTRRVFKAFGLMPVPGDEHLCEYLPWVSDPVTKPWEKFDLSLYDWDAAEIWRSDGQDEVGLMGLGTMGIESLKKTDSEGALEVIESIAGNNNRYHLAMNLPNIGQINNLPQGAIVETPGILSGMGALPMAMGALPPSVAELCRRELVVVHLAVDATVKGDRQLALQCLLLDPVIRDLDVAQQILDDYLITYKEYLPTFWN